MRTLEMLIYSLNVERSIQQSDINRVLVVPCTSFETQKYKRVIETLVLLVEFRTYINLY